MKWVVRIALALCLLLAIAVAAALVVLPRLVESEQVKSRIESAAREATGRSLSWDSLEFGLLPPSLRVLGASVSGERPSDPPLLEAAALSLRVELLPLFVGAVVIDSLVIDGAALRLERGPQGLVLPHPPERKAGESASPKEAAPESEAGSSSGPALSLAVRSVELRDSSLALHDAAVRPAVDWQLADLDVRARGESLAAPIALDLSGRMGSGGGISAEGSATTAGELDLTLRLDGFEVAPLAPYLEAKDLAGALSGELVLRGPAAALASLDADLRGRDVRFRQGDNALSGELALKATIATPTGAPNGRFEVDATAASLAVGGGFTKPPGVPAQVTGRIAPGQGGGLAIEDVKLVIRNLEARGRIGSLSPLRVELSAPPFELAGWQELVPALSELAPSGRLSLEGLRFAPRDLRGSIRLDDVALQRQGARFTLQGAVVGEGAGLRSQGMTLETAGQKSDLELELSQLFDTPRYAVKLAAKQADSNQLLGALLAKPDTLYGPLGLDLSLAGALGGDPLRSLGGTIDFGIDGGRIVGVSLLRAVFDRLGSVGNLAVNLGRAFGGRDLQRFYGDEFELLRGSLRVREGIARSDDLTLRYRGYSARLAGTLGLADLALDMSGDLTIQPDLDAEIARGLALRDYQPRERVVPLARVRGPLGDPKVSLDPVVATRFAAGYAGDAYAGKLREKAEKELGPGGGALVDQGLGVLEGILGGGRARPSPAPAPAPTPAPAPSGEPASDPPAGP